MREYEDYEFINNPEASGYADHSYLRGGGYEWSAIYVYKNLATGELYWVKGSGCSCYGMEQYLNSPFDLRPLKGSEVDFMRACMNTSSSYYWTPEKGHEFYSKVMRDQPNR